MTEEGRGGDAPALSALAPPAAGAVPRPAAPRCASGLTLSGPLLWLLVAYIGSLVALLVTSLYHNETVGVSTEMVTDPSLENFRTIIETPVYKDVAVRTIGAAVAVTVIDLVIALPVAFFMAKVATTRSRRGLVIAVTMPLWAGYLVKGYAWRGHAQPRERAHPGGVRLLPGLRALGHDHRALVPLAAVHGHPHLRRASTASRTRCWRRRPTSAARPAAPSARWCCRCWCPSIVAGSIFTFSLTLGDFYVNRLLGGTTQFIGNNIYSNFGVNLPLAAAYAAVPILIMVAYLMLARAAGALEEL